MKAYEFQTNLEKGTVKIPPHYLQELTPYHRVRVIILTEDLNDNTNQSKLSSSLLMPELDDEESIFERDKDTGKEINL